MYFSQCDAPCSDTIDIISVINIHYTTSFHVPHRYVNNIRHNINNINFLYIRLYKKNKIAMLIEIINIAILRSLCNT